MQAIQLGWLTQTAQAQQAQPVVIVVTATPDPNLPAATIDPAANPAPANPTGGVTVTVTQNTNCREGPSQEFNDVGALTPGQTAEVVGKDTVNNYWIIKLPSNPAITCWLWGQYAVINGDTSTLKEVVTPTSPAPTSTNTPLPTATNTIAAAVAPAAPAILTSSVVCSDAGGGNRNYAVQISWADNSTNETAFWINATPSGSFYGTGANATTTTFTEVLPAGTTLTASLTAQNGTGSSAPVSTTFVCP